MKLLVILFLLKLYARINIFKSSTITIINVYAPQTQRLINDKTEINDMYSQLGILL